MRFHHDRAELFVPDGLPHAEALGRTTHLAIGAHPDDLEIMAIDGILQCFQRQDRWFTGVIVTDGGGSPRDGLYRNHTDEAMRSLRVQEQKKAAVVGEYGALVLLAYPSSAVKDRRNREPLEDVVGILEAARPEVVYTHNLADKHPTHVRVGLLTLEALRVLPPERRPRRVYGCEVWRSLDWMPDQDKVLFDCSTHENLQAALLGVFDSQIAGGKRYDLATLGRRRAQATYAESHQVDTASAMTYAMDLTPLIEEPSRDIQEYVRSFMDRFASEVQRLIAGGP